MKIKQLKEKLADVPDDFDIELWFGHSNLRVESVQVAHFGKSVDIHADIDSRLDEAEEALAQIYMLCGHNDPSEGEGTTAQEVVAAVKQKLSIKRKRAK